MLTNNFYTIMRLALCSGRSGYEDLPLTIKAISGELKTIKPSDLFNKFFGKPPSLLLGSGTAPVAVTDYKLGKPWGTCSYNYSVTEDDSGNIVTEITGSFGSTSSAVTITEAGLRADFGDYDYSQFLIDRVILDTPIVLAKGETGIIKYRLTNASVFNF